jgi:hypothetical protein
MYLGVEVFPVEVLNSLRIWAAVEHLVCTKALDSIPSPARNVIKNLYISKFFESGSHCVA